MEITLLHHPLLIYPRWRLPDYTTPANLPQIEITLLHPSPAHLPQMEITQLHHTLLIYPDRDYPTTPPLLIYPRWRFPDYTTPANLPQMEITLLHQTVPCSFTPNGDYPITPHSAHLPQIDYPTTPPLLIYPRWRFPDYTTPANLPQMEITLLHQTVPCSFTPNGDYPITPHSAHLPQIEITLLHHPCSFTPDGDSLTTPPLLIYPRWRLPYYTRYTSAYLP